MSANPIATVPMSSSYNRSGKHPTDNIRSAHFGLSRLEPSLSRRCISPAMPRVLKWISRTVIPRQWMDIDKREKMVVRQESWIHATPSRRFTKEGNVAARFSTSSSVRLKAQLPFALQWLSPAHSVTKFRKDDMEDNNVGRAGVFLGRWRTFGVSLMFVFIIAAAGTRPFRGFPSSRAARRWSHGRAPCSIRSSSRDGKVAGGKF